jgi:hypothetical protein
MALVVEDGTGKADAESYLSVADCDTYHTKHGDSSDWSGASTADKEEALRMGTQYLDAIYNALWIGTRANETQALDWPRSDAEDYDGFIIGSTSIPQALKDATAEAAVRHITETNGLFPDVSEPGAIKSYKVKVGPVEEATEYVGGQPQVPAFRIIDALLRDLLTIGRVQRA